MIVNKLGGHPAPGQRARRRARAEGARRPSGAREGSWILELEGDGDLTMERLAATARATHVREIYGRQLVIRRRPES